MSSPRAAPGLPCPQAEAHGRAWPRGGEGRGQVLQRSTLVPESAAELAAAGSPGAGEGRAFACREERLLSRASAVGTAGKCPTGAAAVWLAANARITVHVRGVLTLLNKPFVTCRCTPVTVTKGGSAGGRGLAARPRGSPRPYELVACSAPGLSQCRTAPPLTSRAPPRWPEPPRDPQPSEQAACLTSPCTAGV